MTSFVDDDRFFLFLVVVAFCNLIPMIGFFAYLIASSFVIVSSALLAEVFTLLFGLAVFVPIIIFSTLSAVVITVILIIARSFLARTLAHFDMKKESLKPLNDTVTSISLLSPSQILKSPSVALTRSSTKLEDDWDWPATKKYE
ncbi:hypothetical protein L596_025125 [Steinernema carpocapsae]|uniref:Uncharacterized protein n=1 Tax=Steinernema carpocapsae TaxID=34508 RepID=A0A4U5M6W4_STECR|nr:hypothetical protein L596_025125 [Steinernema carpocapsae]